MSAKLISCCNIIVVLVVIAVVVAVVIMLEPSSSSDNVNIECNHLKKLRKHYYYYTEIYNKKCICKFNLIYHEAIIVWHKATAVLSDGEFPNVIRKSS